MSSSSPSAEDPGPDLDGTVIRRVDAGALAAPAGSATAPASGPAAASGSPPSPAEAASTSAPAPAAQALPPAATPPRPAAAAPAPPGTGPAPAPAGRIAGTPSGNALPIGTRLGEFALTRVIGEGGFGIVYEARDTWLERRVALKEYMPAELAERSPDLRVASHPGEDEELFRKGLQSFINEAKILARFDHPSLVKVYRFWEANGTAYMVMPYYEGPTLQGALRALRQAPEEDWLLRLLDPLTHALAVIHEQQVYHRDISPDNILLLAPGGRPVLLDFGAARRVITDANQRAPTAIVKPGYAPIEQYSDMHYRQGPWSDVYALAAVLHYALTGRKPPAAVARLAGDAYVPLTRALAGQYSLPFLDAIDRALAVKPADRTPGMDALRAGLGLAPLPRGPDGRLRGAGTVVTPADDEDAPPTLSRLEAPTRHGDATPTQRLTRLLRPEDPRRRRWIAGIGGAALLAAGGLGWWAAQRRGEGLPAAEPALSGAADGSAGQAAAPAPAGPASAAVPPAPGPAVAAAAPAGPFSVLGEFERVRDAATPGFAVTVQWQRPRFSIKAQDVLAMNISSTRDGYVYVLVHTPDDVLFQYFPNDAVQGNTVRRFEIGSVPRRAVDPVTRRIHDGIVLTEPAGRGHVLVIVSSHPRDFDALVMRRESIYPVFPTGVEAVALREQAGDGRPIYLGRVVCPEGAPGCADEYGAAVQVFDIVP